MNSASDFSPVESTSTKACAVSRKPPVEVARGPLGTACKLVDDLLRRASIGERDLIERQSQVGPGEGKGVKAGLGTGVELADAETLRTDAEIQFALGRFEVARARAALGRAIAEEP